jgi:PKD repeat protein
MNRFLVIIGLVVFGCGEKNTMPTPVAPSNLSVTAVVTTDNSGNVQFTATANNAESFDFDFGNGIFQNSVSGNLTYRYPASGTYSVNVIAKNSAGQMSKSLSVIVVVVQSMIWSDEFSAPGAPDPSKWGYDIGAGGWGNNESQYYTNRLENATVSNGTLKIVARAESFGGSNYTSARLLSRTKFSFKYGKIEVAAKLPTGVGTWPAIWMLPSDNGYGTWPASGEIDIMEHVGYNQNNVHSTIHCSAFNGQRGNQKGNSKIVSDATTEFHDYRIDWTPYSIKGFVDDEQYFEYINDNTGFTTWPFNRKFHMILNIAIGGNWGGAQGIDDTIFPATMEVDYVKAYKLVE